MSDKDSESTWEERNGLSDERTFARIYPTEEQKRRWKTQADEEGFSSLSKYLIALITDAEARRELGSSPEQDDAMEEELQEEVDRLRSKLKRARQKNSGQRTVSDAEVLKKFLSTEPQTLSELLKRIVESGALDDFVRKQVEDQLYFMAEQDDVIYDRRQGGWRLPRSSSGGEMNV